MTVVCNAVAEGFDSAACPANFITLDYPSLAKGPDGTSTFFTGVRAVVNSTDVLVSGNYVHDQGQSGIIFQGNITSGCGTWHLYNYPNSTVTVAYGPNSLSNGDIQFVGDTQTSDQRIAGYIYQGPVNGTGTYTLVDPSPLSLVPIQGTMLHSVMGGFAVGNYLPFGSFGGDAQFQSFIYNIAEGTYYPVAFPNAYQTTSYGIWQNGDSNSTSYTIAGGYGNGQGRSAAFLVDWDSTNPYEFSHWKSYYHNNDKSTTTTHFEGITTDGNGGYNLAANTNVELFVDTTYNIIDQFLPGHVASFVNVGRAEAGGFGTAIWTDFAFPTDNQTSSNTVYQNQILGVYWGNPVNAYVATFSDCIYESSCSVN